MVTIVNYQPSKSVVKQLDCRHCGVTLEYVPADVKQHPTPDYTGMDYTYGVKCPNCKTINKRV